MSKYFYCKHCGERKRKNPRLKNNQSYCGAKVCQRTSRNKWERERLKKDPLYYAHRKKQKTKWRKNRPCDAYQRNYRQGHPEYNQRNRELQRSRNTEAKKHQLEHPASNIVKTDSLIVELKAYSGIAERLVANSGKL